MIKKVKCNRYDVWDSEVSLTKSDTRDILFPKQTNILKNIKFNNIVSGDKVFFTKSVTFPRMKFREWAKKNDVSIVRSVDKATKVIIDYTNISNIINLRRNYKSWLYKLKDRHSPFTYIIVRDDHHSYYSNKFTKLLSRYQILNKIEVITMPPYLGKGERGIIDQFFDIFNTNMSFVSVEHLDTLCNNGIVIDYTYYKKLQSMINSSDVTTKELSLELIANSDYEKSYIWLEILWSLNYYNFEYLNNWSNVMIKSFRSWANKNLKMRVRHTNFTSALLHLLEICKDRGIEVPVSEEIVNNVKNDLLDQLSRSIDSDWRKLIKIDLTKCEVKFSDSLKDTLKIIDEKDSQ